MGINTPIWANAWSVDEAAECLPGMLASGAYEVLWSRVDEERRVTLDEVWTGLCEDHQKAIVDGYEKSTRIFWRCDMDKIDLAAAMAAFEQKGGKIEQIAEGVSANPEPKFNDTLKYCACGCEGDWTDHSMRKGEGKFADQ